MLCLCRGNRTQTIYIFGHNCNPHESTTICRTVYLPWVTLQVIITTLFTYSVWTSQLFFCSKMWMEKRWTEMICQEQIPTLEQSDLYELDMFSPSLWNWLQLHGHLIWYIFFYSKFTICFVYLCNSCKTHFIHCGSIKSFCSTLHCEAALFQTSLHLNTEIRPLPACCCLLIKCLLRRKQPWHFSFANYPVFLNWWENFWI